jgi:hypothetical protein
MPPRLNSGWGSKTMGKYENEKMLARPSACR